MKLLYISLLILSFPFSGKSTETLTLSFTKPNIQIELTYNDGTNFNGDNLNWYYEGLCTQLNSYISYRKKKSSTSLKFIVTITLFDASYCECCPFEMKRNKNECNLNITGKEFSLDQLTQFIDYFYHSEWKPITCSESLISNTSSLELAQKKIDSLIPYSHYNFYDSKITTVYTSGTLKIDYEKDSLILKIDNRPFPININFTKNSIVPIQVGKWNYIADDDSIYVVKEREIISSIKRPNAHSRYSRLFASEDWVIYSESNTPRIIYSRINREFYRIEENE